MALFVEHPLQSLSKAYLETSQTSRMELLKKIFQKGSILDVRLGSKNVSALYYQKFSKMQLLNKLSDILDKFVSLLF